MNETPLFKPGQSATISLAGETRFVPNGIVSRTVFHSPQCRVVLFAFAAGQGLTEHTTVRHVLLQALTGQCEFTLDGKVQTLRAGDILSMPPGAPHALSASEPFSMLLTMIETEKPVASAVAARLPGATLLHTQPIS